MVIVGEAFQEERSIEPLPMKHWLSLEQTKTGKRL